MMQVVFDECSSDWIVWDRGMSGDRVDELFIRLLSLHLPKRWYFIYFLLYLA